MAGLVAAVQARRDGADVGNVMHTQYLGGLSVALVTGRIAGRSAATV